MRKLLIVGLLATAAPSYAATLTVDTGWQDDILGAVGNPTNNSPWTFTIASGAHLSLVDCCVPGDTYTLSGDVSGTSSFYSGTGIQTTGAYGSFWGDAAFSKFSAYLGAGTYTFSVTGDGVGGIPAGLGLRVDSAVPEAATWAMMIAGFGLAGATMRRRRLAVA